MPTLTPSSTTKSKKRDDSRAKKKNPSDKKELLHDLLHSLIGIGLNLAKNRF